MSEDDLEQEACERLEDARRQKVKVDQDLREGLFFAAPHRARDVSSRNVTPEKYRPKDAAELNTSLGMELAGDFVTQLVNTFFPQGERWAMRKASLMVADSSLRKSVEDQAAEGDKIIFDAFGESNFYTEVGKGFNPDAALGTVAMWVDQPAPHMPLRFQAVPIRELEINIGPYGDVDDRFVVRHTKFKYIKAILPGVAMPQKVRDAQAEKQDKPCEVARGFWRVYHDDGAVEWQYVALVDDMLVDSQTLKGDGSCPLIVARFNPSPEFAWGDGPLIQGLPDLRVVDELALKRIRAIDLTIEPPVAFPDDSFANISEGLEAGMAYPLRPGSEGAIKNIYDPPPQDPAIYFINDQEQRLKRLFFLDYPDQPGKTPPTATQWLDEMTMAQRRFGTPGLPFWWEFCAASFTRAEWLLEKSGAIKAITDTDGKKAGKSATRLRPYNPAEKAIEQQTVAQFARFVQIAGQAFPEEFKLVSDGTPTIDALAKIMGVQDIWFERKGDAQKAIVSQLAQLKGGATPGAPAVPDGPPAQVPPQAGGQPIPVSESLRSQAA